MRLLLTALLVVPLLAGCLADDREDDLRVPDAEPSPGWATFEVPEAPSGLELVVTAEPESTQGIWVEDGLAYLSGPSGLRIVDVRDPAAPVVLAAEVEEVSGTRDVDLVHHSDGRTLAVLAHGGAMVSVVDVSDPAAPTLVSQVTDIDAAHNIATVPGTTLVYVSHSILVRAPPPGESGKIDIIDLADPAAPVVTPFAFPLVAMTLGGVPRVVDATTCHDMTFEPARSWALCAGVTQSHIWDVSDPMAPQIVQVIDWPGNNVHHGIWSARGGNITIIGDEFAGAVAGPVCTSVDNPYAALWFFDTSDPATPLPLGYYQVEHDSAASGDTALCTTHFGDVVEDRDLFAIGWYSAGTALVDFSDPAAPVQVAHYQGDGTSTWEARVWNGHVFTGDSGRGMEILRIV